jgi:hypothetical protein
VVEQIRGRDLLALLPVFDLPPFVAKCPPFVSAVPQVMDQGIHPAGSNIRMLRKVPACVEQRARGAPLRRTVIEIVQDRIGASSAHIGIATEIPLAIEERRRRNQVGVPAPRSDATQPRNDLPGRNPPSQVDELADVPRGPYSFRINRMKRPCHAPGDRLRDRIVIARRQCTASLMHQGCLIFEQLG